MARGEKERKQRRACNINVNEEETGDSPNGSVAVYLCRVPRGPGGNCPDPSGRRRAVLIRGSAGHPLHGRRTCGPRDPAPARGALPAASSS